MTYQTYQSREVSELPMVFLIAGIAACAVLAYVCVLSSADSCKEAKGLVSQEAVIWMRKHNICLKPDATTGPVFNSRVLQCWFVGAVKFQTFQFMLS